MAGTKRKLDLFAIDSAELWYIAVLRSHNTNLFAKLYLKNATTKWILDEEFCNFNLKACK